MVVDSEIDDFDPQLFRYKPESLEKLEETTKFTRKELKAIYRGFKQACPSGCVDFTQFKDVFSQLFFQGDCSAYARLVFNSFSKENENQIRFEEFVGMLSTLLRGTRVEQLAWAFKLYDTDKDGRLTRAEVYAAIRAMYDLMGKNVDPPPDEFTIRAHTVDIFKKLDADSEGYVSFNKFLQLCLEDQMVCDSLVAFNTFL